MKYRILILIAFFLFLGNTTYATEKCGTMSALERMIEVNPTVLEKLKRIENFTQKNKVQKNTEKEIITIPVVFHVVYATISENISDEQIMSQLDVLNEDFRKLNANADQTLTVFKDRAADFEIEFCLAQTDPEGFPTKGIQRVFSDSTEFTFLDNMKVTANGGSDAWPANEYLNFWVCDLVPNLLGYAQFPGMEESTDGVVVDYKHFGRGFDAGITGRTATHEVGHWLNLRHIWGDGDCTEDDLVDDTPPASDFHEGCPLSVNTCTGTENEPDMVQNYMDYSDDECLTLFTEGQKERTRAIFEPDGPRHAITTSNKCAVPQLADFNVRLIEIIDPKQNQNYCTNSISPVLNFRNFGNNTITTLKAEIYVDGIFTTSSLWSGNVETGDYSDFELDVFELPQGQYKLKILLSEVNNQADEMSADNEVTLDVQVLGQKLPLEQGFETNIFPPVFHNLFDNDNDNKGFELNTDVARSGAACLYINCFEYDNAGSIDEFILPIINLKNFQNTKLEFYNAYARYDSSDSDTLEVLASKDCGATFKSVFKRQGALLASEGNTTSAFVPSAPDKWKLRTVPLSEYDGEEELIVKFICINSHEQNLYIDDIVINGDEIVSLEQNDINFEVTISPNPATNKAQLNIENLQSGLLKLISIDGKVLEEYNITPGQKMYTINLENYNNGTYFINLNSNSLSKTFKLFVLK